MKKGVLLLIFATFLWSGNYICGRFLGPVLPPILLNTIRWTISTMILICLLMLNKQKLHLFKNWKEFSIQGFLGVYAFSTLNYLGLQTVSASRAGMISAGIPIIILLFTPFILKEKIKTKAWIGALISIVGVIILIQGKPSNSIEVSIIGDAEILLSCVAWGLYTVFGKKYGKKIDPLAMTAGAAFYGTIFSAISCIGTVQTDMIHLTKSAWVCIIYVSTFSSVIAYIAWNTGVKIVGAGRAAPYINLLPVWTVLLGVFLLQEQISIITVVGGVITILGAILTSL
ncbi:DMT family transporter [Bacillus sp. dmp10]|uniref:DMT family transporter n=1 Tax=Bacillus sp. dmp10 TaxID=2293321 RepID=UPI000E2EB4A3|nr:EamA/RhaT family transporter [Bacillus sp. dmp10]